MNRRGFLRGAGAVFLCGSALGVPTLTKAKSLHTPLAVVWAGRLDDGELQAWREELRREFERWRRDPMYVEIIPHDGEMTFPVGCEGFLS